MQRLLRERATVTDFGSHLAPELIVDLGERFVIETNDNWWNLLGKPGARPQRSEPPLAARQVLHANPVGGPIYINGVEAGDTIVVEVEAINIRDWGWTGTIEGFGQLCGLEAFSTLDEDFSTVINHTPGLSGTFADGQAMMNVGREVRWPLAPFIGFLATAPARGIENTVMSQGPWGGNVDVREACAGNRIHLNAAHDGGLLFFGDVHGSQGDSELTGFANETAADITLSCNVIRQRPTPGVFRVETPDALVQVDSARNAGSMERALTNCFVNMINWLCDDFGMSQREAYLHMGANSLVRVSVYQFTTGFFCCGVQFPRSCLG